MADLLENFSNLELESLCSVEEYLAGLKPPLYLGKQTEPLHPLIEKLFQNLQSRGVEFVYLS